MYFHYIVCDYIYKISIEVLIFCIQAHQPQNIQCATLAPLHRCALQHDFYIKGFSGLQNLCTKLVHVSLIKLFHFQSTILVYLHRCTPNIKLCVVSFCNYALSFGVRLSCTNLMRVEPNQKLVNSSH